MTFFHHHINQPQTGITKYYLWTKNALSICVYHPWLRRLVATALVIIGTMGFINHHQQKVLVAKQTLYPGVPIDSTQVEIHTITVDHFPESMNLSLDDINHHYLTTPIRAGEFISKTQILDNLNAQEFLPQEINPAIVPLSLHDSSLLPALTPGRVIDIIAKRQNHSQNQGHHHDNVTQILASHAVVVSISNRSSTVNHNKIDESDAILYCAMSQADAQKTAENSSDISFILH